MLIYFALLMIQTACVYSQNTTCENVTNPETEWEPFNFPNPQVDIYNCGRCNKSWICDPNQILSKDEADELDKQIEDIRISGTCGCHTCKKGRDGYSIAIAIVYSMKNPGANDLIIESTAMNFARSLRNEWNFGNCSDDAVIFISQKDRKIFTNVGTATEKVLDYDCLENIYLQVKSKLTVGRYADALTEMIEEYQESFEKGKCSVNSNSGASESETSTSIDIAIGFGSFFGISILIFVIAIIVIKCKCCSLSNGVGYSGQGGRGRGRGGGGGWVGGGWGGGGDGGGGGGGGGGGDGGGGC